MRRGGKRRAQGRARTRVHVFTVDDLEVLVIDVEGEAPSAPELTDAQRDVARRAAAGESNEEIAAARGTSVSTVANQLGAVYQRLGVASRYELAALWSDARRERGPSSRERRARGGEGVTAGRTAGRRPSRTS